MTSGSRGEVWRLDPARLGGSGKFRCTAQGPTQEVGTNSQGPQQKPEVRKQGPKQGKMASGTERAVAGPSMSLLHCLLAWTIPVRLAKPGPRSRTPGLVLRPI